MGKRALSRVWRLATLSPAMTGKFRTGTKMPGNPANQDLGSYLCSLVDSFENPPHCNHE